MSRRRWIAVAVMAAAVAGSQGASGQGRGVPGEIAFFSARGGNNDIYIMHWDGRDPFQVTSDPASDVDPDISTNGRDITFTSNRTGNNDIYVVGSAGGSAVNLTNDPANDMWPRWSPDGRHIVFHSNRDGNFEIYVIDAFGGAVRRMTDYPGIDQFPDWSPDGRHIVFRRDFDIHVLEVASGQVRRLTERSALNQMGAWSPNGHQIVFMSTRDGYPSVFLMNADGSGQRNLTPKTAGDASSDWVSRAPSWSTNGRHIFFMSSRPSTGLDTEVFVMNADGTGVTRLTESIGMDGSPRGR